ncbi:MAG: hypothetical protein ABJZ55_05640 [Fuerstiella sp.]
MNRREGVLVRIIGFKPSGLSHLFVEQIDRSEYQTFCFKAASCCRAIEEGFCILDVPTGESVSAGIPSSNSADDFAVFHV